MIGHIHRQFHAGIAQPRTARAKKSWDKTGLERLQIGRKLALQPRELLSQFEDQFSRQQIAAGFTGHDHEGQRFHGYTRLCSVAIWRVISIARSRACLADSPLTRGVWRSRTQSTKC